jgi:hypothetical protein
METKLAKLNNFFFMTGSSISWWVISIFKKKDYEEHINECNRTYFLWIWHVLTGSYWFFYVIVSILKIIFWR